MNQAKTDVDYYVENYPYHVEMISKVTIDQDVITVFYENGKTSQFCLADLGLTWEQIEARFQGIAGNIVYVYQDKQNSKDIALELFDITGCCSGTRNILLGYQEK
jgi:hypothetical protein